MDRPLKGKFLFELPGNELKHKINTKIRRRKGRRIAHLSRRENGQKKR